MNISRLLRDTLTLILAGGQGERLYPLTKHRAKPAVPFAGQYRLIDFTMSNCVNSGLKRIYVLTQYLSQSLDRHLKLGWDLFSPELDECLYTIPPQFRRRNEWYLGTADAVFQNVYILQNERPANVLILGSDHIYKMDYSSMIEAHVASGALVTVGAVECDCDTARRMGVLGVDADNWIRSFDEKPAEPQCIPGRTGVSLVNMGVYVFETDALVRAVSADARQQSTHDFGRDILPGLVPGGKVLAFPFADENRKAVQYWRDIGTLESYYEASMDLVNVDPLFNLYDRAFPLHTYVEPRPPAKMVFAGGEAGRIGMALDSLLCNGCIVSGGRVERSILSPDVRVNSYALVEDSILFNRVDVGRHARIRRAIIDKNVKLPAGFTVGYDREQDEKLFTVTESGLVVIPKGEIIP